jgi:AmiR/NasT family two-component response regulator
MTEGLQSSLHSRDIVSRACGVLMEHLHVPHGAALQRLMKQARDRGTTLQHASESVLAGTPASGN